MVLGMVVVLGFYGSAWAFSGAAFGTEAANIASLVLVVEPNFPEPEGIYYVDGVNGSDDSNGLNPETAFATVQKGIDTATDGNTVIVYPALYNEAIDFLGKAITVQGVPSRTGAPILQAPGDYAVSFYRLEGPDSLLKNFVIRGSDLGIFIVGSSPTISNVTVVDNVFGIAAYSEAQPDISNSIVWNNTDGDLFGDSIPLQARYSFIQDENEPTEPNKPSAGLVSHWKFDEGTGTMAYDSVGDNHGNVYGATWATGKINGSLSFDGLNDYVSVPHDVSLNITGDITIVAWINIKQGSLYQGLVTKCVGTGPTNNPYDFRTTNSVLTLVRAGATGHERTYSDKRLSFNQWYHVLIRVENKVPDFYVDGVITGKSQEVFTQIPAGNTKPILIGRRDDGLYFDGIIDEVLIYDRALSVVEIGQLYQLPSGSLFGEGYHLRSKRGRHWPAHDVWVLDNVTSPCIDGGDPNVNPYNERMPNGGRINMGAYGNTAYASLSEWPIAEDNNRDGVVNMLDIARLAAKWLEKLDWVE
jgi:hypothetical protein